MYYNFYHEFSKNKIHIFDDDLGLITEDYEPYCYMKVKEPTELKSIFGDYVRKVPMSQDMKEDSRFLETDVAVDMRVLIDRYHAEQRIARNDVMFLDIEVSSKGGFPDMETANKFVTVIGTSMKGKRVVFVFDKFKKFTLQNTDVNKYIVCDSEVDMLRKFVTYFSKIAKPTIISGWNSWKFDIPYLVRRIKRVLGAKFANLLSAIGIVTDHTIVFKKEDYVGYKIAGVNHLDYMLLYKKYSINEQPRYSLNYIASVELDEVKKEYDGSLDDLYERSIDEYVDYNIQDIHLLELFEDKLHYIQIAVNVAHKGHIPYEEIFYQSKIIEGAILVYFKENGIVSNNKPEKNDDGTKFKGAFVKPPKPGLHKWVYACDLTSLYPSIMRNLNISPETKIGKITNINKLTGDVTIELVGNKVITLSQEKFEKFIKEKKVMKSAIGVLYRSDKQGFAPIILTRWFNERVEYKKLMKKAQADGDTATANEYDIKQYVTKILLNSFYGAFGLKVFRFYDKDNAESVTQTGQEVIKTSQDNVSKFYAERNGKEADYIVYGDTDSLYVSALPIIPDYENQSQQYLLNRTRQIAWYITKHLNEKLIQFTKDVLNADVCYLVFNQETIGRSGIWSGKKKYAIQLIEKEGFVKTEKGMVKSGFIMPDSIDAPFIENPDEVPFEKIIPKLKVTGLDVVKSDFPKAFKNILKDTLIGILDDKGMENIKKELIEFKKNLEVHSIIDLAIPKGLHQIDKYYNEKTQLNTKGAPIHAKSAINYNFYLKKYELTTKYREIIENDKIKFVFLKKNQFNFATIGFKDDIIPDEMKEFIARFIDRPAIFDSVLFNKLQDFWDILGWGKLNLEENKLSRFF